MQPVRMVFTKWGGRPHWEYDAVVLGRDGHGLWLGLPTGSEVARPGAHLVTREDQVVLVPEAGYVATFYADGGPAPCEVYVDITTRPVHDGPAVRAVDLDLDVLRGRSGRVWVDDEDEFAEPRLRFGYPDAVVADAVAGCEQVRLRVEAAAPPFDRATAQSWLSALRE